MYILTDGKNYIMENPVQNGKYISTTSVPQATEFSFKQAKSLLVNKKSSTRWINSYYMVNKENNEVVNHKTECRENIYNSENSFEFDESIIKDIKTEVSSIIGLAAWDINQLKTYNTMLNSGLSYYDSAISDIRHAQMDKRPPAHIRTKINTISNELEEKRRDVKQVRTYIDILIRAIEQQWTIGKIKMELSGAKYVPYKGRTKYYDLVNEMLDIK
jgi:uncharacterized protein (UPF0147 family)